MEWQTRILVLSLLTVHVVWHCSHVSFGKTINCWWNKAQTEDQLYIECHALPAVSTQKCPCDLQLQLEEPVHATLHHCTKDSAHFIIAVQLQAMQNTSCTLMCHGQDPEICTVKEGYPPPTCSIPLEDKELNMNCSWSHNVLNPMVFTLYLEDMHGTKVGGSPLEVGGNSSVIIQRAEYMASSHLKVWLSASNALGSVQSDKVTMDTGNIIEPEPPYIYDHSFMPLEILWEAKRADGLPADWLCKVQYRLRSEKDWTEDEATHEANFVLDDDLPFTTYTFRVRCWLSSLEQSSVVMSDWSTEYHVSTPPAAPRGKLDVWSICEQRRSEAATCKILWKEMPVAQAQSKITKYTVRVRLRNGSDTSMDRPGHMTTELCAQCRTVMAGKEVGDVISHNLQTCDGKRHCFQYIDLNIPITEMTSVYVAASSEQGESSPSRVALPSSDVSTLVVKPKVRGATCELNVSWEVPEWFSHRVQEYVVQHKPTELPHIPCLNWVRVDKTQNSIVVKGPLLNYTAYNVSLFAVVNNCSHLLGSDIAYTVQRVPPKVTDLQIIAISSSSVDLAWTLIPFHKSPGLILHYLLGLHNFSVANVSRNVSRFQMRELKPGQRYVAWISAVSMVGEGERAMASFTTIASENYSIYVVVPSTILFISFILLITWRYSLLQQHRWQHRIPDPINSNLFKGNNNETAIFQHTWHGISNLTEHGLKISNVEVMMVSDNPTDPEDDIKQIVTSPLVEHHSALPEEEPETESEPGPGGSQEQHESGGHERTHLEVLHRRKDYLKVIDSDDEQGGGEDEEWEEQPYTSDYERHFLPCV